MLIKEKITSELEILPPEILEQVFNFMQLIKNGYDINAKNDNTIEHHHLKSFEGIFDDESAKEIRNSINTEFQNIEGEW